MDAGFLLFALLGLLVVGAIAYANYLTAKKRAEAMAAVAAGRGWEYTERDDSWAGRFDGPPFGEGFAQQARNIVRGVHDGRKFVAFDYRYSTREGSGKNRHTVTHDFSIVGISTTAVLPHLSVVPEGWFGRMWGRLTDSDIQLESEVFNQTFTVTCEDRKFATDVLHPRMMELLLRTPDLGWSLRNGTLLIASPGQHDLPQLDAELAGIDRIIDAFPATVWKDAGIEDPGASPPVA